MRFAGARRRWKLVRIVITAFYLSIGWVLFSGSFTVFSIVAGLFFSLTVAVLTYDAFIDESESSRRALLPSLHWGGVYVVYLLFRVYVSSFRVMVLVFRRTMDPRIVHFRTRLRSDVARVALATSITLTPGTITLELDDDHLIVHWLDSRTGHSKHAARAISGGMERYLRRIWV